MVYIPHELLLKIVQSIDNSLAEDAKNGRELLASLRLTSKALNEFATQRLFARIKLHETFDKSQAQISALVSSPLSLVIKEILVSWESYTISPDILKAAKQAPSYNNNYPLGNLRLAYIAHNKSYSELLRTFFHACKGVEYIKVKSIGSGEGQLGPKENSAHDLAFGFTAAISAAFGGPQFMNLKGIALDYESTWEINYLFAKQYSWSAMLPRDDEIRISGDVVNLALANLEYLEIKIQRYGHPKYRDLTRLYKGLINNNDRLRDLSLHNLNDWYMPHPYSNFTGHMTTLSLNNIQTTFGLLIANIQSFTLLETLSLCDLQLYKEPFEDTEGNLYESWATLFKCLAQASNSLVDLYTSNLRYTCSNPDPKGMSIPPLPELLISWPIWTFRQDDVDSLLFLVDAVVQRRTAKSLPFHPWLQEFCYDPRVMVVRKKYAFPLFHHHPSRLEFIDEESEEEEAS